MQLAEDEDEDDPCTVEMRKQQANKERKVKQRVF